jgi:hypothetical protein
METILKYRIPPDGVISMPEDAVILHVDTQDDAPGLAIWALVESEAKTVSRKIAVFKTGQDTQSLIRIHDGKYVGTVHRILHVFDLGESPFW